MKRVTIFVLILFCLNGASAFAVRRHKKVRHTRQHRHARLRRIAFHPMFPGSHDMLVRQNIVIDQLDLPRIADDEELEILEDAEELVPVDDTRALMVAANLSDNRRYCRPWTRDFLQDLSEAYYREFHVPLVVTSLVRTAEQQHKLRRHNRNAAPEDGDTASTHLTGMTIDILKRGMSRKQHKWMNEYMLPLKQAGKIDPIEERRQPVFHVVVFSSYSNTQDEQPVQTPVQAPATVPADSGSSN